MSLLSARLVFEAFWGPRLSPNYLASVCGAHSLWGALFYFFFFHQPDSRINQAGDTAFHHSKQRRTTLRMRNISYDSYSPELQPLSAQKTTAAILI